NVSSPTLSVHLTYLRGSRRSESAVALSTSILKTGTGPVDLKNSADASGLSAARAGMLRNRMRGRLVHRMRRSRGAVSSVGDEWGNVTRGRRALPILYLG